MKKEETDSSPEKEAQEDFEVVDLMLSQGGGGQRCVLACTRVHVDFSVLALYFWLIFVPKTSEKNQRKKCRAGTVKSEGALQCGPCSESVVNVLTFFSLYVGTVFRSRAQARRLEYQRGAQEDSDSDVGENGDIPSPTSW